MAKAKSAGKLTANAAAPAVSGPGIAETGDFPDALAVINSLAGSRHGIEWNLRVYKVENAGRGVKEGQPFLFEVGLDDLPNLESQLAEIYPAGGTFRVQCRADNQLVKIIKLEIAARPGYKPPPPSYLAPLAVLPPVEPREREGDRLEIFFTRMMEAQARADERTRELIASIARPATQPSLMDQIALFSKIQELMPKGAQESTQAMFEKGMEFATKIFEARGSSEGGTNWLDIVKEAISSPIMKDMLGAMANASNLQQQQPGGQPPQQIGNAPPPFGQAPAFQQPAAFVSQQNPIAVQIIDTLMRQAAAGVDPKFVATQAVNNMPPALMEELEGVDDVLGYLISQFPQIAQRREWFAGLVAEIWDEEQTAQPSHTMQQPDARPALTKLPQA